MMFKKRQKVQKTQSRTRELGLYVNDKSATPEPVDKSQRQLKPPLKRKNVTVSSSAHRYTLEDLQETWEEQKGSSEQEQMVIDEPAFFQPKTADPLDTDSSDNELEEAVLQRANISIPKRVSVTTREKVQLMLEARLHSLEEEAKELELLVETLEKNKQA